MVSSLRAQALTGVMALLWAGCDTKPAGQRAQEQLAELQRKRVEAAKAAKADPLEPTLPAPGTLVKLEAPYDDTKTTVLAVDGPCPDGFWALFGGDVPGRTPEEKKANKDRRAALAKGFEGVTFMVKLRGPGQVTLQPHDAAAGKFVIEVPGTIDCVDSMGRVAIAWTGAKAVDPKAGTGELAQFLWQADPVHFELPMTGLSEAKAYYEKNRLGLSARVVFTLGKTEVDKKLRHTPKIARKVGDEVITGGGGDEDWGAGRLVHAELLGLRVATDRERTQLFDQRGK